MLSEGSPCDQTNSNDNQDNTKCPGDDRLPVADACHCDKIARITLIAAVITKVLSHDHAVVSFALLVDVELSTVQVAKTAAAPTEVHLAAGLDTAVANPVSEAWALGVVLRLRVALDAVRDDLVTLLFALIRLTFVASLLFFLFLLFKGSLIFLDV